MLVSSRPRSVSSGRFILSLLTHQSPLRSSVFCPLPISSDSLHPNLQHPSTVCYKEIIVIFIKCAYGNVALNFFLKAY